MTTLRFPKLTVRYAEEGIRLVLSRGYRFAKRFIGAKRAEKIKRFAFGFSKYRENRRTNPQDLKRLKELGEKGPPLKLHFGCHRRLLRGWVNVDVVDLEKMVNKNHPFPDLPETRGRAEDFFVIDFTEGPLPLPDNSVEVIFHEDFLEHINQRDTLLFLAETFRILKPGGVHHISTPDLAASMKRHSRFAKGHKGVFVYEWDKHIHLNVLTPAYLKELAALVGYRKIIFTGKNQSRSALVPPEYRPIEDREEREQIFCDLIK